MERRRRREGGETSLKRRREGREVRRRRGEGREGRGRECQRRREGLKARMEGEWVLEGRVRSHGGWWREEEGVVEAAAERKDLEVERQEARE